MSQGPCPSREQLHDCLVGVLADEAAESLLAHLGECPSCQALLATLDDAQDTLIRSLRQPQAKGPYTEEPACRAALARLAAQGDFSARAGDPPAQSLSSTSVLGRLAEYQLLAEIGQGGMGKVYRALQTRLGRTVAIKVLPRGYLEDERAVARFQREMRATGAIDHPNVVRALHAGEADGKPYLAMEYVEGLDLGELVRRCGPLPIADACELVRQAALGLQAAHEHGLVHRDIKPSNLMLSRHGQVKVLDLGLARFIEELADGGDMTDAGQPMGTANYMAPEQVADSHAVDIRADVYSLGCTLYRLLTDRTPFGGPEYSRPSAKMEAHRSRPVPPVRAFREEIPEPLAAAIERMLAKIPAARLGTPAEVAEVLLPFTSDCDLPRLLRRADQRPANPGDSRHSTMPLQSSVITDTWTSEPAAGTGSLRHARHRWPAIALLASAGLTLLFGVLYWVTDRGTLEIQTHDPNVQIVLSQNGKQLEIIDPSTRTRVRLHSGRYQVRLPQGRDDLQLSTDQFTLSRGQHAIVEVRPVTLPAQPAAFIGSPAGGELAPPLPDAPKASAAHAGSGRAPRPGLSLLFAEDFPAAQRLPERWRAARGTWQSTAEGMAVHMAQPYYPGFLFAPPAEWRDYALQCEMRHDQAVGGLIFRHDVHDRFYVLAFRHEERGQGFRDFPMVQFQKFGPVKDPRIAPRDLYGGRTLAQKEYVLARRTFHVVRVEVVGPKMVAFVDGRPVLEAEDTEDVLAAGSIGLHAADECFKPGICLFRNLRVESLGSAVAEWSFDEGQGRTARDTSGNGNHGQLHAGATWTQGRRGAALRLDGVGGFVRVPDHPSQSGMHRLAIHGLFQLHALPEDTPSLVRKWGPLENASGPLDDSFNLFIQHEGRLKFQVQNGANLGYWLVESKPLPLDRWIEAMATYDGQRNTLRVRIDDGPWTEYRGFDLPSEARGLAIRDTQEPLEIGCSCSHRAFLNATIDWIRLSADAEPPQSAPAGNAGQR